MKFFLPFQRSLLAPGSSNFAPLNASLPPIPSIAAPGPPSVPHAPSVDVTESEVNLGGGQNAAVEAGAGGAPTSGFAALFESLKEGGGGMSFFKGIRGALPKIKVSALRGNEAFVVLKMSFVCSGNRELPHRPEKRPLRRILVS